MKILKCVCGTVRSVPRRQKFCSSACARPVVLANCAKNRANQIRRARERLAGKTPREIFKTAYESGWNMGYRRALKLLGRKRVA